LCIELEDPVIGYLQSFELLVSYGGMENAVKRLAEVQLLRLPTESWSYAPYWYSKSAKLLKAASRPRSIGGVYGLSEVQVIFFFDSVHFSNPRLKALS
jgi:hypothetical protein